MNGGGGGMGGGITQAITDLLLAMGVTLPPWAMPAIVLGVAVLLLPFILKNMRTAQARKLVKRASLEGGAERQRLEQAALAMVRDNPEGALSLAEACVGQGRYRLAQELLAGLPEERVHLRREKRRLLEQMAPPDPPTPEAAAALVERLLEQEQVTVASERLGRALRRWPEDSALRALQPQVQQVEGGVVGSGG